MAYLVFRVLRQTCVGMQTLLFKNSLSQFSENSRELTALAMFVLSHGEDNGTIFAQDYMYR